ncbi:unnamed protein product [Ilex paraguariensis]|uniref:Small auxin up regulated protein n=1 Tax=Ilex paraguariensis TaxID=185542 RepID=A0ABC8V107_9AQUA
MKKIRGFLLKHRVTTLFRWFRRNFSSAAYHRLDPHKTCESRVSRPISKIFRWAHRLRAKIICSKNSQPGSNRGYMHIGEDPVQEKPVSVPKGHMAVYVGQKDGDFRRILVPVMYFNHPLFGDLLREAEKEYGYNHPGGITLPCRISEFESVKTRIKASRTPRKTLTWN